MKETTNRHFTLDKHVSFSGHKLGSKTRRQESLGATAYSVGERAASFNKRMW